VTQLVGVVQIAEAEALLREELREFVHCQDC
jgi:hypothetical protein